MSNAVRDGRSFAFVAIAVGLMGVSLSAQGQSFRDELELLARPQDRKALIEKIAANPQEFMPFLKRYSESPPGGVDPVEFSVGMSQVFGRLRTPEGIPYLVKNLSLQHGLRQGVFHKNRSVIVSKYPAVGALIEIGTPSLRPVAERLAASTTSEERCLAIFVIGAIGGTEARKLLLAIQSTIEFERRWIDRQVASIRAAK